jgi:DME family drug/metabolite transporter
MTDDAASKPGGSWPGGLLIVLAAVFWSISGVAAKSIDLPPEAIAFYRSLFAGLALFPFVPRSRMVFRPMMFPMFVIFGAMCGTFLAAVKLTTAANAILLQCTASFWVIPIAWFAMRERPDRQAVWGILVAMAGIVTIVGFGEDRRPGESVGIYLGLASGLAYACVVVGLRFLRGMDPTWLSAVNNFGGAVVLGIWITLFGGGIPIPDAWTLLALAGFGIVQMAIPYALFARGLQRVGAAEAGLLGLLEPILNPTWVFLLVGEAPDDATKIGGAILLAGLALRFAPLRAWTAPKSPSAPQSPSS